MGDDGRNLGAIGQLAAAFCKLPGIGPKTAERLTFFLLNGDRRTARGVADALKAVVEQGRPCPEFFNLADGGLCPVCADPRRDGAVVCVVETPRDLALVERAGGFRGHYHVLGGRLAPLENMGPEKLTADSLLRRVQRGGVQEVILATSPPLE